jgi:hypothetical protein
MPISIAQKLIGLGSMAVAILMLLGLGSEQASAIEDPPAKKPEGKGADLIKARNMRWVMRFKVSNGQDYVDQLKIMEAEILIPIPDTDKMIVIKDLSKPDDQKNGTNDDFERLGKKPKFYDDRKEVVMAVAKVLKVDQHAPKAFWAFFPKKVEEELAKKELSYGNKSSEDIEETKFLITIKDGKYEIQVIDQKLKLKK